MEVFDYVVSAHGVVVFQVFEDYYVHEVLDYPTIEGGYCLGVQSKNRFEMYICSRI